MLEFLFLQLLQANA